jgi:hypothetical protein
MSDYPITIPTPGTGVENLVAVVRDKKLVLVKRVRSKRVGYSVEYAAVKNMQARGWWAARNPSMNQRGDASCIDGFYYDPFRKVFGVFQAKRRYKYLHREEKERIKKYASWYNAEASFWWRDKGMHYEVIREIE